MRNVLIIFLLVIISNAHAQSYFMVGARSAGLSNASVALEDVWAFHNNPGALAGIKRTTAGLYYEARFGLKELQTQAAAVAIPLKVGVISAGGQFFGYEQYRSSRAGVGYSMPLGEHLSAGVQLNGQQLKIANGYGSSLDATVEAGLLARITGKWTLGASVMNIGRQRIAKLNDDYFSTVMRVGVTYLPTEKVRICAEVEKQVVTDFSFRGAVEYLPVKTFYVRIGAQSGPTAFGFGLGYRKNGLSIDAGSRYHTVLGWTPNVGLNYQFGKDEE